MKALCLTKYGSLDFFSLTELPDEAPGANEVLVKVRASALNPSDFKVALGELKFLHGRRFPMPLGYDFSGEIISVGERSGDFHVGEEVFGFLPYGPTNHRGAFAEKLLTRSEWIACKPPNISHATAAASATSALTSLQAFRDVAKIQSGARVLITGVSGGVGSVAVQIAIRLGASEVVAIGSGKGLDLAAKFGAMAVIDRKNKDVFTAAHGSFDVIFDAAAAYRWSQWKNKLKQGGTYITTIPSLAFAMDKIKSLVSPSTAAFVGVKSKRDDLKILAEWLADGLIIPIDATIELNAIPQALAKLRRGEVLGKIAVNIDL